MYESMQLQIANGEKLKRKRKGKKRENGETIDTEYWYWMLSNK